MTPSVRIADPGDLDAAGLLLHQFNCEYQDPTPGPEALARRLGELVTGGDTLVLVGGEGPDGVAVLRFRKAIWSEGSECYLAELYVVPERRGQGLGTTLMEAALEEARRRGADTMDLGTSETDLPARRLYERLGFTNREHGGDGPVMYVYERDL